MGNLALRGERADGNRWRSPPVIAEVQEEPFALKREHTSRRYDSLGVLTHVLIACVADAAVCFREGSHNQTLDRRTPKGIQLPTPMKLRLWPR